VSWEDEFDKRFSRKIHLSFECSDAEAIFSEQKEFIKNLLKKQRENCAKTMKPEIYNILRNQLKTRHNRNYKVWFQLHRHRVGSHSHHLLDSVMGKTGKLNDFFLVNVDADDHLNRITYGDGYDEGEFEQYLAESLNDIFDYIEYLQEKLKYLTK
jgi:hypothetical protein